MKRLIWMVALSAMAVGSAGAQVRTVTPRAFAFGDEPNAPRIGVYLGDNGVRDTLGVLVDAVTENGPAAKAGIKEGDRLQAIGGVNLRMNRDDAEDPALRGMMSRRLTRELDKLKAGDEVELRVLSGSASRTVRVKTVTARELAVATPRATSTISRRLDDRASVGLGIGGSMSRRDTLGVFVMSVTADGPAEKAGIVEGDRIARINGMDLRVPSEDAGDRELSRARARRFSQELGKLKAGDAVTMTVVSGGRSREVRLNAVKASELPGDDHSYFFNFGGDFTLPHFDMPNLRVFPHGSMNLDLKLDVFKDLPRATYRYRDGDAISEEVRQHIERAMEKVREAVQRIEVKKGGAPIVLKRTIRG